jgi:hypothetical protein
MPARLRWQQKDNPDEELPLAVHIAVYELQRNWLVLNIDQLGIRFWYI